MKHIGFAIAGFIAFIVGFTLTFCSAIYVYETKKKYDQTVFIADVRGSLIDAERNYMCQKLNKCKQGVI
jgi:hypothetical protein